jgi:alanyl-tRNA synthetase
MIFLGHIGSDDVDGRDTAYRIIADHIRTLTIALADGACPGSDGRSMN